MIDVRGWGYLTGGGSGALGLDAGEAERLQDDLGRLLCAAPDLLEALILALPYVEDASDSASPADQEIIRAAIRKATGEAS